MKQEPEMKADRGKALFYQKTAVLILAGGQGKRLGGVDKPLLPLVGDKTILDYIAETIGDKFPFIFISANGNPARFAGYSFPVLPDGEFLYQGPLAGIKQGCEAAAEKGAEFLLTLPGDMPFFPENIAERLWPAPAYAFSAAGTHYLTGLWPVTAASWLKRQLETGKVKSARSFVEVIQARAVFFDEEEIPVNGFLNVNTPKDREEACLTAQRRIWPVSLPDLKQKE